MRRVAQVLEFEDIAKLILNLTRRVREVDR